MTEKFVYGRNDGEIFVCEKAKLLSSVIKKISDKMELVRKILGTEWRLNDFSGELCFSRVDFGTVISVTIHQDGGVTICCHKEASDLGIKTRKDRWESAMSVFPDYTASGPVFDEMISMNKKSELTLIQIGWILDEIANYLTAD